MWIRSLGQQDPLEDGMATHSSILVWRILWTEESGGLQLYEQRSLVGYSPQGRKESDRHMHITHPKA